MNTFAPAGPPSDEQLLRLAVQNLACHPQAQRRYAQMGWFDRATGNLKRIGGEVDGLVAEGKLDREQASAIGELRDQVEATLSASPHLLDEERCAPREFLFSDAFEDEKWEAVRRRAREIHHELSGDRSVFVSIMAK